MGLKWLNTGQSSSYEGPGVYSIHCEATDTVIDLTYGGHPYPGNPDIQSQYVFPFIVYQAVHIKSLTRSTAPREITNLSSTLLNYGRLPRLEMGRS